jgi:hypothetical protein
LDSPELAIRLRRAEFNRALADGRPGPIGSILAPRAQLVTGTDSAVITGRTAQLAVWKQEFAAARRTVYSRMPQKIDVSAVEPIALESGHWEGLDPDGAAIASGTYAAKWRRFGKDWMIEAEIFVTLG